MEADLDHIARNKLVWGWLRLFLGAAQIFFATASLGLVVSIGLHPVTYLFVAAACAATVVSRLLYRGRATHLVKGNQDD